jgi:hypothetical protein
MHAVAMGLRMKTRETTKTKPHLKLVTGVSSELRFRENRKPKLKNNKSIYAYHKFIYTGRPYI